MKYYWNTQNLSEHRVISDYLYFSLQNLEQSRKKLESDLKRNIEELRLEENISDEVTDREIEIAAFDLDADEVPTESKWWRVYGTSDDISFTYTLENLLYESFIFLWCSFVERRLKDLLEILSRERKANINRRPGFIYQFYDYLDKEFNCKIDKPLWDELVTISSLRNILIHNGNQLPTELLNYIKLKGIYNKGYISLNRKFCFYLFDFSEKLFSSIDDGLSAQTE